VNAAFILVCQGGIEPAARAEMVPTKEAMLIGLAVVAGFALTMGGWNPVSPSYGAGLRILGGYTDDIQQLYRLATWTAVGAGAVAAFVVLRRRH
jgi:hypothetical protein